MILKAWSKWKLVAYIFYYNLCTAGLKFEGGQPGLRCWVFLSPATKIIGSVSLSSVLFAHFVLLSNLLHRTLTFCSLLNSAYFSLSHKCSLPTTMFNSAFSGPNKMSHLSHFYEIVNGSRFFFSYDQFRLGLMFCNAGHCWYFHHGFHVI